MRALVSLTDRTWFNFLAGRAREAGGRLDEVNFWRPRSQQALRSIGPGAPFFLRLKSPVNAIAGYGFFAHWHLVPFLEAWELFGEKNGAPTMGQFRKQIAELRHSDPLEAGQKPLGCVILRDVTFFEPHEWLPWAEVQGWAKNIVNDKQYDLTSAPGNQLLALIANRIGRPADLEDRFQLVDCDTRNWREQVVARREGQGSFKLRLLEAYGSRCAVTGERVVPVLDAAHIQPYLGAASNHVQNGLLLRTDLHRLYDQGLVTVTPDSTLRVSERLEQEWHNGKEYYEFDGHQVAQPTREAQQASRDALAWHGEFVFR